MSQLVRRPKSPIQKQSRAGQRSRWHPQNSFPDSPTLCRGLCKPGNADLQIGQSEELSAVAAAAGAGGLNGRGRSGAWLGRFVVRAEEPLQEAAGEAGEGGLNLGQGEPKGAEDKAGFDADAGEAPGAAAAGAVERRDTADEEQEGSDDSERSATH